MRQRGYAFVFLLVLLTACAGAYFGGRFFFGRFQDGFQLRGESWAPPTSDVQVDDAGPVVLIPTATRAQVLATPTPPDITTPMVPTLEPFLPSPQPGTPGTTPGTGTALPTAAPGTGTPTGTATATSTATADGRYAFRLARPVRHSSGDCPGVYILGQVTDRSGNPVPDVRLWLVDEYGNQEEKISKSEPAESGKFDFPLFGPARRFYLSVVDGSGHPASAAVEIYHGGAESAASCHWVDWQRQ